MKTLFLSLTFVLCFIVCSGHNPPDTERNFIVVVLDGNELEVGPITTLDFDIVSATAPAGGGRTRPAPGTTPLSTEIRLVRRYQRNSDWKEWIKENVSTPRTKRCELKTVNPEGSLEDLVRRAEAEPIHYQLFSGFEALTIKVINIEF